MMKSNETKAVVCGVVLVVVGALMVGVSSLWKNKPARNTNKSIMQPKQVSEVDLKQAVQSEKLQKNRTQGDSVIVISMNELSADGLDNEGQDEVYESPKKVEKDITSSSSTEERKQGDSEKEKLLSSQKVESEKAQPSKQTQQSEKESNTEIPLVNYTEPSTIENELQKEYVETKEYNETIVLDEETILDDNLTIPTSSSSPTSKASSKTTSTRKSITFATKNDIVYPVLSSQSNKYVEEIDHFIRGMDDFHVPHYYYNIDLLIKAIPPPKTLGIRTRGDFTKFLRLYPDMFKVTSDHKSVELLLKTPLETHRGDVTEPLYGYFHCVDFYCEARWESIHSLIDQPEVCPNCKKCQVYPYRQRKVLPTDRDYSVEECNKNH